MQVSLKINTSVASIERMILDEFANALNDAILAAIPDIKTKVGDVVKSAVGATPEVASLLGGKLNKEFGLKDASNDVEDILNELADSVTIDFNKVKRGAGTLAGGITVGIVLKEFGNLFKIGAAKYTSGHNEVKWLEWLVLSGDRIIIADYGIKYKNSSRSRSKSAFMVENNKGWRVPPEFSGTENNNFITRAFTETTGPGDTIAGIIEQEITRKIK